MEGLSYLIGGVLGGIIGVLIAHFLIILVKKKREKKEQTVLDEGMNREKINIRKIVYWIGVLISVCVGYAFGWYMGFNFIVPFVLILISGFLVNAFLKQVPRFMLLCIAVLSGLSLWMLLGSIILKSILPVIFDLIILVVGIVWLINRPSIATGVYLSLYLLSSLVMNLIGFLSVGIESPQHKVLLVHIVIRITALLLLFKGIKELQFKKKAGILLAENDCNKS